MSSNSKREPMARLIEEATQEVEANGYLNADSNSVQLAMFGYLVRELQVTHADTRAVVSEGLANLEVKINNTYADGKSKRRQMMERAKMPGIFAGVVAVIEGVRAFLAN